MRFGAVKGVLIGRALLNMAILTSGATSREY